MRMQARTCAHTARVSETYERQVFCIKDWGLELKSYIVWEPFQTPIFQLYKALYGIFQKHTENPEGKSKIH